MAANLPVMLLSSVARAGRTRAESARQQAPGQARLVVATSAPAVLAEAAAPATAGAPCTNVMDYGPLCEDGGESNSSGVLSGSSLKCLKHARQPGKDSSSKHNKHTLSQAPSPSLLLTPRLTAPSSPTHSSCHSLLVSGAAPTCSDPSMAQQVSGSVAHTHMQPFLFSALGAPGALRSLASQLAPMQRASPLSSPHLSEDDTPCTHLKSVSLPCSGGIGSELQDTQVLTPKSPSEWCESNKSESSAKDLGYVIYLSGGYVDAFMASTGVPVLSVHNIFQCMGHSKNKAGKTLASFMFRQGYEDGGPWQLVRARHPGQGGRFELFASVEDNLSIVRKYWGITLGSTKTSWLITGKEQLETDLLALLPKVRDIVKPKSSARLLETPELGFKTQPYPEVAPKAPAHCTISEDVSSCRLDPVPISSSHDPIGKKRNDLFTSVLNVVQFLDIDEDEMSDVIDAIHNLTDDDVTNYMATTHQCMRVAWNSSNKKSMHNLIKGIVKRWL